MTRTMVAAGRLSSRQQSVLDCILETPDGVPRTIREIGEQVGLRSPSSVVNVVNQLRSQGLVTWDEGKSRSLRAVQEPGVADPAEVLAELAQRVRTAIAVLEDQADEDHENARRYAVQLLRVGS